jgi:CubicO group peptidase (beta-lactamase class C family)
MPPRKNTLIYFACVHLLSPFLFIFFIASPIWASSPERDYWPTDHWRQSPPEAQGMDSEKLLRVIPFIIENLPEIQSLLVVRGGYIVFENYYGLGMPDRQKTVHSVTKSVTATLFGIAKDRGLIEDLNLTLPEFFPEYFDVTTDPRKKTISLKHLLTMTAGLQPVNAKDRNLFLAWTFSADRVKFTLDLPVVHTPGEIFAYSNPVSHLLAVILEEKSGQRLASFAARYLFQPLGIDPRLWKEDAQGHNTGHGGLYLSTRHMAKIGFLYLNRGLWDGKRIVSADWIDESTRIQVSAGREYAYGYQWWIRPVTGCHSFRAWGRNGQFIVIVPDLDLVVVVTSRTRLPGKPSAHYAPLFDIVAEAVLEIRCTTPPE